MSPVEKKFEITTESEMKNLPRIGEFITETMRHYNIQNSKDIYSVQLAVDEACTNVIQHAYSKRSGESIVIRCMLSSTRNKFIVNIIDWGKSFDPTIIPKPDTESCLDERKEGGLGIFFMRKFMDEVKYVSSNGMNILTMVKYLKK